MNTSQSEELIHFCVAANGTDDYELKGNANEKANSKLLERTFILKGYLQSFQDRIYGRGTAGRADRTAIKPLLFLSAQIFFSLRGVFRDVATGW